MSRKLLSSMTESTLRSLDSALRGEAGLAGAELCRRVADAVGDEERGDIGTGEGGRSAHSEDSEGKTTAFGL